MEKTSTSSVSKVLPVLFGFFIMGFVDIVGNATNYAKLDFNLSETMASLISTMIFIWFFFLSIPTAILMNRIGRKRTVQLSYLVTFLGMVIPFISYTFTSCMVAFALLGIGNAILQVSLNPLLTNVVQGKALSSSLTTGQMIKAISAFCGPFIATFAMNFMGKWQYIFPIYAAITLLTILWLSVTKIKEDSPEKVSSVGGALKLLKDRPILLCFLAIFFVVGVDVCINVVTPKLLIERASVAEENAGLGTSVYFLCRTVGAFIGAVLLTKMTDMKYFRIHIWVGMAALAALFFTGTEISILAGVGLVGYAISSMFAVIFSQAMKARPEKANEISGLMVMGICGGAIAPLGMGVMADWLGSQSGSLMIIAVCMLYLLFFSVAIKTKN